MVVDSVTFAVDEKVAAVARAQRPVGRKSASTGRSKGNGVPWHGARAPSPPLVVGGEDAFANSLRCGDPRLVPTFSAKGQGDGDPLLGQIDFNAIVLQDDPSLFSISTASRMLVQRRCALKGDIACIGRPCSTPSWSLTRALCAPHYQKLRYIQL